MISKIFLHSLLSAVEKKKLVIFLLTGQVFYLSFFCYDIEKAFETGSWLFGTIR